MAVNSLRCPHAGMVCIGLSVDCRDCVVFQRIFSSWELRNIVVGAVRW